MGYIHSFARDAFKQGIEQGVKRGVKQGIKQGRQEGEYELLLRQLEFKFKTIPEKYRRQMATADAKTLLIWGERIIAADTLEEIFANGNNCSTL